MSLVINAHTHFQPESVLPLVEEYGITMRQTPEGAWYFRSGNVEYSIPARARSFGGAASGISWPTWTPPASTSTSSPPAR